jgi:hypothetical protein
MALMDTALRIAICLLIFAAGFTLGQGHGLLDFNGDGQVSRQDLKDATDRVLPSMERTD